MIVSNVDLIVLGILRLKPSVKTYDWGSQQSLKRLLGRRESEKAEAELWMGAYSMAPSEVQIGLGYVGLDTLISERPTDFLGRYSDSLELPFLFKFISLGGPVSVQVHPNRSRAEVGFTAEDLRGIPVDAPNRCYRDQQHKSEMLLALEPMVLLCGFKPEREINEFLVASGFGQIEGQLQDFIRSVLSLEKDSAVGYCQQMVENANREVALGKVLVKLEQHFPGDPAIVFAGMLNLVELDPGQAMFTPAGQVHAYLSGAGLELMTSCDNVVRAGLTSKYVDIEEFIIASDFNARRPELLSPCAIGPAEQVYSTPVDDFCLSMIDLKVGGSFFPKNGPEILLLLGEEACVRWSGHSLNLRRGDSLFVPASIGEYRANGVGQLYRARLQAE